jgi:uncharacterized protein
MGAAMNVIDFRVRLRTPQMLKPWNPDNPAPHFEQYIQFYKMHSRLSALSLEDFIEMMHQKGVGKSVVCGGSIEDNDHLIDIKKSGRDNCFYFIAGVNPQYGIRRNLLEVEKCHQQGFLGVNISPYIWGIEANSKLLYPVYAYCESNNLIAIIHASLHYNRYQSMWLGDPKYVDEIAIDFPNLKIVVSHAGNGFGILGLAVAQKHPNIFLEFSALWPKYLPETTLKAVNSYLKNRCLFGTDYPLVDFDTAIESWDKALKPQVKKLFFEENAKSCLFEKAK